MDERAEFEAWAKQAGWSHSWGYSNTNKIGFCSASWNVWQAATQRQQERIAELEAQVEALKPKAAHFEETVAMWSHAYNNALHEADAHRRMRLEAEAQVQALSLNAARYQFLRAGGAYLEPNSEEIYMATDDGGKYYHDRRDLDMDIDAAIEAGKGEG